ncbi:MATE family efflux transporter [Oceanirhabdus sp. W0125-5]|uniref:MATE family efflux transporter n=1 Tax=Oceanirhabdus sp. W0125-5 TaxID=2999116 RepID=UPI0022F2F99C|nr:MATE family efflux transporter [Oceanirhabdus sp. W0125-5]WBW99640.1 MATE family efflux transporter [Oceanirhabdus sp. W0125-5]
MSSRTEMLGKGKISKVLLKLSLPATVGMIVNALYNVVDAFFVGRYVSQEALGALTVAMPVQMVIMAFALMIGIGAASLLSRSLGAKEIEKADHVVGNAIISILAVSITISVFGLIFINTLMNAFGATSDILSYAKDYTSIILIGTLYFPFVMACNNLIRAEGNAMDSMMIMIIGTGLNLILDPIFIGVFNMGIKGAAYATILSQFASLIYIFRYYLKGKSSIKLKKKHFKINFGIISEICTVGFSSFLRNFLASGIAILVNNMLKEFGGSDALSIYGAVNRITMFLFMPLFGVIQGMQPIAGFNYGAKKYDRVLEVVKLTTIVTIVIASLGVVIGELFAEPIVGVFFKNKALVGDAAMVLRILISMIPIVGIQIVGGSLYQSLGKALPSFVITMLRQVIIFIPLLLILPVVMKNKLLAVWITYPLSDLLSTLITSILIMAELRKIRRLHETTIH